MLDNINAGPVHNQLRPKDGSDNRLYAPDRDLAYAGVPLIRGAVGYFEVLPPPESVLGRLLAHLPPEERGRQLGEAARCLATWINRAVKGDPDPKLSDIVADTAAWHALDPAVQTAMLSRLGAIITGAVFAALRDITPMDGAPPNHRGITHLVEVAERVATALGTPPA